VNTALRRLFPDSVALASCRLRDFDEPSVLPAELAQLCESFSTARRTQFLCGRWCAARALEQLDAAAQVIGRGADREPVWPPGITGSISHSGDWAIAAVSPSDGRESIGLDIELHTRSPEGIWRLVLTEREKRWVRQATDDARARTRSILLFSAKEAFYKWQFPRTRSRLGFLDVDIRPASDGMSLTLELLSEKVAQALCDRTFTIRYTIWDDYLVTGIHQ
jgi:4'-phosphopantetheinyl transferase EntD